jgi:hypothetical protein
MSVKVFDKITAIASPASAAPIHASAQELINKMLATAGIAPGGKLPIEILDKAPALKPYSIAERIAIKAQFGRAKIIDL